MDCDNIFYLSDYLIPDEIIIDIANIMDNVTFKRFSATCTHIKYICEQDYLLPIVNKNVPIVLLSFDLQTLANFNMINRRMNNLVRSNDFWYLKLMYDYPNYIKRIPLYQSYIGKVMHQDIVQNCKNYYLFYKKYDQLDKNVENNVILFDKFIHLVSSWRYMPVSMILMLLSLTYHDTGLDKRLSELSIEKLSVSAIISSLLPKDYNNSQVFNGIFISNGYYQHYHEEIFTTLPQLDVNLHRLIEMYFYLNKPIKYDNIEL